MAWGGEPRDRERSPWERPGGTSRGAAAAAAHGPRREAHLRIIWQFHGRISASFGPRPGYGQRSYVRLKWGVGRDSDIRVNRTQATRRSIAADLATSVK
jgi:hypothetical protein